MPERQSRVVLVTCGTLREARRIANAAVEAKLAACVNVLLNPVESNYRWKDKVEVSREYLLVMKSTARRLAELERMVRSMHSYDVPEFLVLPVVSGSREYLRWLVESVKPSRTRK
ncbi:MAG TPA: divalent-cation tolerance protein CutA [Methylomirabilota bacterium]|jgi:periplasmic divalent cation tolerance protein|nr:divalent-cation tolerance protein CutA [Methylomirabilota bacterium]